MKNKINIEENKKLKENPFGVPEGYFEGIPGSIMGKIKMDEAGHENPFLVPPAYFEELPNQIIASIAMGQLNKLKEDPHGLPDGYFNDLADRIKSRIAAEEQEVKVITLEHKSNTRTYWAIAASVAIVFGISSFLFYMNSTSNADILLSENTKTNIIENPDLYNIDEASMLDEMGISEEEAGDEQNAEELLLDSETELGTEINETE